MTTLTLLALVKFASSKARVCRIPWKGNKYRPQNIKMIHSIANAFATKHGKENKIVFLYANISIAVQGQISF